MQVVAVRIGPLPVVHQHIVHPTRTFCRQVRRDPARQQVLHGQVVQQQPFTGEEPYQQLDDDLRRFKQVMETGGRRARQQVRARSSRSTRPSRSRPRRLPTSVRGENPVLDSVLGRRYRLSPVDQAIPMASSPDTYPACTGWPQDSLHPANQTSR